MIACLQEVNELVLKRFFLRMFVELGPDSRYISPATIYFTPY